MALYSYPDCAALHAFQICGILGSEDQTRKCKRRLKNNPLNDGQKIFASSFQCSRIFSGFFASSILNIFENSVFLHLPIFSALMHIYCKLSIFFTAFSLICFDMSSNLTVCLGLLLTRRLDFIGVDS